MKWHITLLGNDSYRVEFPVEAPNVYDALIHAEAAKEGYQKQTIEKLEVAGVEREDCSH